MKTYSKFLLTVGLLSVAFAGMAPAQTVVRITGSSAFRGAVTNAILNLLNSPTAGYVGSSLAGANTQLIEGTLKTGVTGFSAGTSLIFKTSWTGSLSGIVTLTTGGNTVNPFLSTSNTGLASATPGVAPAGATGGAVLSTPIYDAAQTADVAMSDVFQSSTTYTSPTLSSPGTFTGSPAPGIVGVVPFVWVAGAADSADKITNINSNQIQQLLAGGLALSQLTGNFNSSDSSTLVLPVGRDADSGTRFNAFTDSGYSIIGVRNPEPTQYYVITSGGGCDVEPYPAETLPIGSFSAGQGGYSSGSGVATDLSNVNTNNATTNGINNGNQCILVGYVGESDGKTAVTNNTGAHFITYNGVSYGTYSGGTVTYNRNLVDNGVYTFWGYEHMYYKSSSPYAAIANAIGSQIANTDATVSGEILGNMEVNRGAEGGPIGFGQ